MASSQIEKCGCDVCRGAVKQPPAKAADAPRRRDRKPQKPAVADEPLNAAADARYEALREVRTKLAKRDGVPAFCVMHDSVLREVSRQMPDTPAGLLKINGIGQRLAEKYGGDFLAAIRGSTEGK